MDLTFERNIIYLNRNGRQKKNKLNNVYNKLLVVRLKSIIRLKKTLRIRSIFLYLYAIVCSQFFSSTFQFSIYSHFFLLTSVQQRLFDCRSRRSCRCISFLTVYIGYITLSVHDSHNTTYADQRKQ